MAKDKKSKGADGVKDATITGAQPQNDLAVLQATKLPDDLLERPNRLKGIVRHAPSGQLVAYGYRLIVLTRRP